MRLTAPAFDCDQSKRKKSKEKNPTSVKPNKLENKVHGT